MSSINESTLNRLIESANINLKGNETVEEKLTILKHNSKYLLNCKIDKSNRDESRL